MSWRNVLGAEPVAGPDSHNSRYSHNSYKDEDSANNTNYASKKLNLNEFVPGPLCHHEFDLINCWLHYIRATKDELNEVMLLCGKNKHARSYYLGRAKELTDDQSILGRHRIVIARLRESPNTERVYEVVRQGNEFRMAIGIRGKGTIELSFNANSISNLLATETDPLPKWSTDALQNIIEEQSRPSPTSRNSHNSHN